MENPYGLYNLWSQGDVVTRGVAMMLLTMSALSWYVMAIRAWHAFRMTRHAADAEHALRDAHTPADLVGLPDPRSDNLFRLVAHEAAMSLQQWHRMQARGGRTPQRADWIADSLRHAIDTASSRVQGGLGLLASVSSTAPFIGLFGTVWGIYHALVSVGIAGQASIDKVAGPVGEALIMTALGLAVAIPATLGYNMTVRANKALLARLRRHTQRVHTLAVAGSVPGAGEPVMHDAVPAARGA